MRRALLPARNYANAYTYSYIITIDNTYISSFSFDAHTTCLLTLVLNKLNTFDFLADILCHGDCCAT